jgi:hypothetical protein
MTGCAPISEKENAAAADARAADAAGKRKEEVDAARVVRADAELVTTMVHR